MRKRWEERVTIKDTDITGKVKVRSSLGTQYILELEDGQVITRHAPEGVAIVGSVDTIERSVDKRGKTHESKVRHRTIVRV
jgi:hypothetical protein